MKQRHWLCLEQMSECQTKAGNQEWFWKICKIENLKTWKLWKHWKWSFGHAEKLLFSCLGSKVTVYRWKCQCFFGTSTSTHPDIRVHGAGSQLKSFIVYWWLQEGRRQKLKYYFKFYWLRLSYSQPKVNRLKCNVICEQRSTILVHPE